jgi:hypothetical protein
MSAGEWIKQHKKEVAIGAAAVVGLLILSKRGSSGGASSGGGDGTAIAQLQASQNVQQANIQAGQNQSVISAQVQVDQTNAELQAQQNELVTGLAQTLSTNGTQASLEQEQLEAEIQQQQSYDALLGPGVQTALATAVKGGNKNSETGLNELALLLNEESASGIGSFNAGTTATSIASTQEQAQLLAGLEKLGGGVLSGIGL